MFYYFLITFQSFDVDDDDTAEADDAQLHVQVMLQDGQAEGTSRLQKKPVLLSKKVCQSSEAVLDFVFMRFQDQCSFVIEVRLGDFVSCQILIQSKKMNWQLKGLQKMILLNFDLQLIRR